MTATSGLILKFRSTRRWSESASPIAHLSHVRRFLASSVNHPITTLLCAVALLLGCSSRPSHVSMCGDLGLGNRARLAKAIDGSTAPFLHPIPKHPGFYFAPGERSFGRIDCRGFAPGSVLRSPYSQRLYRIPFPAATNAPAPGNV